MTINSVKAFLSNKRNLKISAGLLTFTLFILFSLAEPVINMPTQKAAKPADFSFENVTITYLESGEKKWMLNAAEAQIYKTDNDTVLSNVDGIVFTEEKPSVSFQAPTANFNLDSSNIRMKEANATLNNQTREIMVYANTLHWNADKQSFEGHKNTKIRTRGLDLFGDYFRVDIPIKKLIISDKGRAIIK